MIVEPGYCGAKIAEIMAIIERSLGEVWVFVEQEEGKLADISDADAGKVALTAKGRPNILGVQGQLWAETLRCFDHVTYYIFPKALGLFERGWNAEPVWAASKIADDPVFVADFNKFYSIIVDHEMPYYASISISYHKN